MRVRSPSYPAIDLKVAIDRAKILYEKERSSPVPIDVVLQHWGYKKGSGGGMVQVAALKKFGLISDEESGDDRKIRISKLAKDILIPHSETERQEAINRAAHLPSIYQEIHKKYPDGLPSDQTLKAFLIKERNFNDNSIDDFIKVMKATFSFAGVKSDDIMSESEEEKQPKPLDFEKLFRLPKNEMNQHKPERLTLGITLPTDGNVILEVPRKISEDGLTLLKVWIDACWKKLEVSDSQD